jgi:hypothetical protein
MKSIMKRVVLGFLLAALAGSALAAGGNHTDSNGNFTPYDRDSAAASPAG